MNSGGGDMKRVAVATSDGETINEHFGRTRRFMVFELAGSSWHHLEDRTNMAPCSAQEHDDNLLERSAEIIADCQGVVVKQIGPTAIDVLIQRRVLPVVMSGRIDAALLFLASRKKHISEGVQNVQEA